MFTFTFSQTLPVAQEREAMLCILTSLQKHGDVCQANRADVVCLQGTLGSVGIFQHTSCIQREQSGSHVTIAFTCRQQMSVKGSLLALTSAMLAFAALFAGPWFLAVELSAIACITLIAVENTHARRGLLHSALEAQKAVRQL